MQIMIPMNFRNEVPLYRISFEQDIVQRSIRGYIFWRLDQFITVAEQLPSFTSDTNTLVFSLTWHNMIWLILHYILLFRIGLCEGI